MRSVRVLVVAALLAAIGTAVDPNWADTAFTTQLWNVISSGDAAELADILKTTENAAQVRSADGRGPLFWAHEYGHPEMVQMLIDAGADPSQTDADGKKPSDLTSVGPTEYMTKMDQEEEPVHYDANDDDDE